MLGDLTRQKATEFPSLSEEKAGSFGDKAHLEHGLLQLTKSCAGAVLFIPFESLTSLNRKKQTEFFDFLSADSSGDENGEQVRDVPRTASLHSVVTLLEPRKAHPSPLLLQRQTNGTDSY